MSGCWLAGASSAWAAPKSIAGFIGDGFGAQGGLFTQPRGIAVSSGAGAAAPGDIYVAETQGHRVQVLDSSGNFKFAFGRNVVSPGAPGDAGDAFEVCEVASDCQRGTVGSGDDGPGGEIASPQGLALNRTTGDVFVREVANRRVQQFTAAGQFVKAWGRDVVVDGAPGDAGEGFEVCEQASVCKASSSSSSLAEAGEFNFGTTFSGFAGIAVSPVDGHVFATDPSNRRVMEFDPASPSPAGVFVRAFGWGVGGGATFETCTTASGCQAGSSGVANGQFADGSPMHVGVDSGNVVYLPDPGSDGTVNRIARVDADLAPAAGDASGALLSPLSPAPGVLSDGVTEGMTIDPISGNLLVARALPTGETVVDEIESPGAATPVADSDSPHGFAVQPTQGLAYSEFDDTIYVAAVAPPGQGLFVLAENPDVPSGVTIAGPSTVGTQTATFEGSFDPAGGSVVYQFEVSTSGATDDWQPAGEKRYASGSGSVEVSLDATGLEPDTSYLARLTVIKQTGLDTSSTVSSGTVPFMTEPAPPSVTTLGSADRSDTSARLRATVDPNGAATTYHFEYGPLGGPLDLRAPVPAGALNDGNTPVLIAENVSGLSPETAYEYRIVATNESGTSHGNVVQFETESKPGPDVLEGPERRYELVSPADKIAGVGLGEWGGTARSVGSTGIAAHEGERFAAQGTFGAMLLDAAQAYANDWAFADRVGDDTGWQSHSPFTHPQQNAADTQFVTPQAATASFSRIAWRTNNSTQAIFPEMAAWPDGLKPTLMSDWVGRWELFGPTDLAQLTTPRSTSSDAGLCDVEFSADGSAAVCSTDLTTAGGIATVRGLAGPGDPTATTDLVAGRSVYIADTSGHPADTFAGTGDRLLVNICADGTELPAVNGSGRVVAEMCSDEPPPGRDARLISSRGATLQPGDAGVPYETFGVLRNVVSDGGRRVFFMSPDPLAAEVPNGVSAFCESAGQICPPQLFVRQRNADGSIATRWISRAEDGLFENQDASLLGTARFEGASEDGDKVFFRTNSPLTSDDRNGGPVGNVTSGEASDISWDLYMYDFPDDPAVDPGLGQLTRISGGMNGASDCNSPAGGGGAVGALRFVSSDGARAYFTCAAPLQGVPAPHSSGTITSPGGTRVTVDAANLYVYDARRSGPQQWRFVARLPRSVGDGIGGCASTGIAPGSTLDGGVGVRKNGSNCVRGAPSGDFVTMWTTASLTADDGDQVTADIYGYDATTDELVRVTGTQGGVGGTYQCDATGLVPSLLCHGDGGLDADDIMGRNANPILGVGVDGFGARMAFFQSASRLVPADTDDTMDVYQWRSGRLSLVTSGVTDGIPAYFRGNDRTGVNVYFATSDAVTWQDKDVVTDVYTARVNGGIDEPPPTVICDVLNGACRPPGRVEGPPEMPSSIPGTGNGPTAKRAVVIARPPGASARRRAARSGVVPLVVRVPRAGVVNAIAHARMALRGRGQVLRQIGRGRKVVKAPGRVVVRLKLRRAVMRRLERGQMLRVRVLVKAGDAKPARVRFTLKGLAR